MLVGMLIVTPILPALVALAVIVLRVVPRLSRCVPTTVLPVLVAVKVEIIFITALVLPSDQFLDQTLYLPGFVVASPEIQARNTLRTFVAVVPAGAVPAFADGTVCRSVGLWLQVAIIRMSRDVRKRGSQRLGLQ